MLRAVRPASAAFSPPVVPYLCVTAAETAAPPASTSRIAEASIEASMSAAESAICVRVRGGSGGGAAGAACCCCCCCCGWGVGALLLLLPLPLSALELEPDLLPPPMARWIKLSTVAAALLLSFEALPLTAWIWVRFFSRRWGS